MTREQGTIDLTFVSVWQRFFMCFLCKMFFNNKGLKSCFIYKLMHGLKDPFNYMILLTFGSHFNIFKSKFLGYNPSKI